MWQLLVLIACPLLISVNSTLASKRVIVVYDPAASHVDPQCFNGTTDVDRYGLNNLPHQLNDSTELRICGSVLVLNSTVNFTQISNIKITGFHNPEIQCQNGTEAGLNFVSMLNLELVNFTLENCGFETKIDSDESNIITMNIHAGINIQSCTNVNITNIAITNSPGSGLALFYNNQLVQVSDSSFLGSGQDRSSGGNGIYIETSQNDSATTYIIDSCRFVENVADTSNDNEIEGFTRFDKGGGLCAYVRNSTDTSISIQNSVFKGNFARHYGGGLFETFHGEAHQSIFMIRNCSFVQNKAKFGGGVYAGYLHKRYDVMRTTTPINCSHNFTSNYFGNNSAQFGGGLSLFSTTTVLGNPYVTFENCTWKYNSGQYGSAVAILPNAWNLYSNFDGYLPEPVFSNCVFDTNYVTFRNQSCKGSYIQYSKGAGAVYCSNHKIIFQNETVFSNNNGTALHVSFSVVFVDKHSDIGFINNKGYAGGAIYQLSSVIYLSNNNHLSFENNSANDKGGAIYQHTSEMHMFDYSKTCFLDYILEDSVNSKNISVTFINNTAGLANNATGYGHSIYASSLLPCSSRFLFAATNLSRNIFDHVGDFDYIPPNRTMEIATAVNSTFITGKSGVLHFIPGKEIQLPFVDRDDLNQTIETEYSVSALNGIEVAQAYFKILNKTLVLYGDIDITSNVTLSTTSSRLTELQFTAKIEACPPGFFQHVDSNNNPGPCICSVDTERAYNGITSCNLTLMQATRNSNYWIGYLKNETEGEHSLITGHCPLGFCSNSTLLPSRANRTELSEIVCAKSRSGALCGKCKPDHSVHYHSINFKCKANRMCELGWLFYLMSEILPVTIMFLVIIVFNIPFTSGLLNGLIFYAQTVGIIHTQAAFSFQASVQAQTMSRVLSSLYMFFSLTPFVLDEISFCLWKNANVLDILAFSYVTLIYAFFLIIAVVVTINHCNVRSKLRRFKWFRSLEPYNHTLQHSIIHGLSAFLILCYSQCAFASILLLMSERGYQLRTSMVQYNGEITWMSIQHLPYALPAIFMALTIVVIPPILLLVYPIHYKIFLLLNIADWKFVITLCHPLERLKPFLDSFQGCFKDNLRFFSGLYFVYRFLIIVLEGMNPLLGEIIYADCDTHLTCHVSTLQGTDSQYH